MRSLYTERISEAHFRALITFDRLRLTNIFRKKIMHFSVMLDFTTSSSKCQFAARYMVIISIRHNNPIRLDVNSEWHHLSFYGKFRIETNFLISNGPHFQVRRIVCIDFVVQNLCSCCCFVKKRASILLKNCVIQVEIETRVVRVLI